MKLKAAVLIGIAVLISVIPLSLSFVDKEVTPSTNPITTSSLNTETPDNPQRSQSVNDLSTTFLEPLSTSKQTISITSLSSQQQDELSTIQDQGVDLYDFVFVAILIMLLGALWIVRTRPN